MMAEKNNKKLEYLENTTKFLNNLFSSPPPNTTTGNIGTNEPSSFISKDHQRVKLFQRIQIISIVLTATVKNYYSVKNQIQQ